MLQKKSIKKKTVNKTQYSAAFTTINSYNAVENDKYEYFLRILLLTHACCVYILNKKSLNHFIPSGSKKGVFLFYCLLYLKAFFIINHTHV